MKLFLIGTLLFSGGGVAAIQNEDIRENVTDMYKNVRERVQKRVQENSCENLRENGFPYPSEERLANLTEEQQVAIVIAIDQINATYDFGAMTDDEIIEAMLVIQEELNLLADELGLDIPDNWLQARFRHRVNSRTREVIKEHLIEDLRANGIEYPSDERLANLTEEQQALIIEQIDEFNGTYDWATMTDEEIMDAMVIVKAELQVLHQELGLNPPINKHGHRRHGSRTQESEDAVEGTDTL
ncbi:hypothetical protein KQ51_01812 [Candidatus Izimaplasma bacterium HR1]|jgi:hypothetical protein|uniref:hypothetical protein n=1 Tax=Candidatus Izimoplasma sp. HR1 TaxID=1541959 RepID=UPI0004F60A3D|nr:hypothetical protein KQ51_01812 [Candidatus Izimaplasma bacterium HR1]